MEATNHGCATCANLIRLCSGLDYFPADDKVRGLLAERLHHFARDHSIAKAIIDHWLDNKTVAPKVADLIDLAQRFNRGSGLPDGCDHCHGEPFVIREGDKGRIAVRCSCARGQALRAMDKMRRPMEGSER